MAVVVQQTSPFPTSTLRTSDVDRWEALIPLISPHFGATAKTAGVQVLADLRRSQDADIIIAAAPKPGALSSELVTLRAVSAIILNLNQKSKIDPTELHKALTEAGCPHEKPVAVVQVSEKQLSLRLDERTLLVQCPSVIASDHILHLLLTLSEGSASSLDDIEHLVEQYKQNVRTTISNFANEKLDGKPTIQHRDGVRELKGSNNALTHDLSALLDSQPGHTESTTLSVHFADRNGLSRLELFIMAGDIGKVLEARNIPFRLSCSSVVDDEHLDRGYAISICLVPSSLLSPQPKAAPHIPQAVERQRNAGKSGTTGKQATYDDVDVRKRIERGCDAIMKAEPTITEYDTIVGDGDCGYTLRDGAKQVLHFIKDKDLTNLPRVVDGLVRDLEVSMGGTSGALYCIFLTALASSLASAPTVAAALQEALNELLKYTRARLGDRTMMDALIPFVKTFHDTGDSAKAIVEARKGVEGTKKMEAKLGRSTYLDESATQGVPDPGAYGLLILLEGINQA